MSEHDSTCGHCGRTWSSIDTPTPAARCPFEYDHVYDTPATGKATPIGDTLTDMAQRCHTHLCTLWEALAEYASPSGGGFTCNEADALFDLYKMFGLDEMAHSLMCWHAATDDEGDRHMVTGYDSTWGTHPIDWSYRPADSDDDDSE